jgi:hypothetical protein
MRSVILAAAVSIAFNMQAQTFMRAYTQPGGTFASPQAYIYGTGVLVFDDGYLITTADGNCIRTDTDGMVTSSVDLRNADGSDDQIHQIIDVEPYGEDILVLARKAADTIAVMRIGSNAEVLWQRATVFPGSGVHEGILPLPDGSCVLHHNRDQGLSDRPVLSKLAADGTIVWQKTYRNAASTSGSLSFRSASPLADGGILVTGAFNPITPLRPVVAKLAADGTPIWVRQIAPQNNGNEFALAAVELMNGDIRVAVADPQPGVRLATVDLSSTGMLLGARAYSGLPSTPYTIRFLTNGELTGTCVNNGTAFRIDADGDPVFSITYAGLPGSYMAGQDYMATPDGGNLFLGNYTFSVFADLTPVLFKSGPSGQLPEPFSAPSSLALLSYDPAVSTVALADSVVSNIHTTTWQFAETPMLADTLFGLPTVVRELPFSQEAPTLWPNPATDHIMVDHPDGILQLYVTDGTGRLVYEARANVSPSRIETSGLGAGKHHITVVTTSGYRSTTPFLVGSSKQ